ncbi:hypothetical protein AN639_09055 [Candidatus Epulonipiscium fishelsonii]|uniref:Uncharacterized protein n=1 Tax=Candidatus Epulonipiscium fishelsonii TaxID=77094 RepID=A0ACC8XDJ6_9FIRM|nr:hypothetical protein AN639_09055 [Epulopiscium sp. SCG-B05WGA-EpuloA1]ONI40994.1 hypothetical protein AN396_04340 [Epulopiscium sp. SCG-B11WGA-EpuloA1]
MIELIILFFIFIAVLLLAYFSTRKIGQMKFGTNRGHKNLQIVEALPISVGQYIYIVRIGCEYHLMTMTKEHINYCIKLDESQLVLNEIEPQFDKYLKKFIKEKQE